MYEGDSDVRQQKRPQSENGSERKRKEGPSTLNFCHSKTAAECKERVGGIAVVPRESETTNSEGGDRRNRCLEETEKKSS